MADNTYTQQQDQAYIEQINMMLPQQKKAFAQQPYPVYEQRVHHLKQLKKALVQHSDELLEALSTDFRCRAHGDSKMGDIIPTIACIDYTIKQLKSWMKPSKRKVGAMFKPAKSFVLYQPLGVIGIITPWNYPVFLSIGPLVTAIAAGNRAMIKMSEFTPNTNNVIEKLLSSVFKADEVTVVHGGASVAVHFSEQPFDHLLFTGSTGVGKLVMAAAAKNLTPVTLELGGKSPTIIDHTIAVKDAVPRFILGKTLNAGQTCVAPDYILCPANRKDELIAEIKRQFNNMYPNVEKNSDYSAIINDAQFNRLQTWLAEAKEKGATITPMVTHQSAQELDEKLTLCANQGKLPLTIVTDVNDDMALMQNEIFGPILPIISYEKVEQAIKYVNDRPRPLALYLLSYDQQLQETVLKQTHAGGVCLNDAALHVAQEDLPFGGIGPSGMGHYHGHEGFLTFSKAKSVYQKGKFNMAANAFPPYGKFIHKIIDKLYFR